MKTPYLLAAVALAAHVPVLAEDSKPLDTNVQKFSYGVGLQIDMRVAATAYQNELNAERLTAGEKNRATGEKFLAENKSRDGVVALDSGLQYRVVEAGAGESPTETDTVVVHYRGRLLDGTEFDSSYGRGEPTEFGVGQVIVGWQQALQLMTVGAKWEVWIPAGLAYGAEGPASIGPNQTLHFDIELIEIKG